MASPAAQIDRRFASARPLLSAVSRPPRGWIRAIRESLGMTTAQLARRVGVSQPRISELERAEVGGNITITSLQRAAEAMGCRLVYALVPITPLTDTLEQRAREIAAREIDAVDQTMRLENQTVSQPGHREAALRRAVEELARRPSRLWNDL